INIGAEIDRMADQPADEYAENSAEQAHRARLDKKQSANVAVRRAERLEHANFTAAFEDGHHQRVDDAERSHHQREAAENAEKKIEHREYQAQIAAGVEQRKSG